MAVAKVGKAWRLLVVDDQEQIRNSLKRALEFEGYDVMTAGSGGRALDLLATAVFDLVLLDVNMPDIDGFSVLAKMREIPELSGMLVIMVTGVVDSQSVVRGKKLQVSDYLVKPYRIADLLKRVERCLNVSLDLTFEELPPIDEAVSSGDETAVAKEGSDQR
jgi:two-component system alkaline phosphatase synthesis response regulator PhoP